MGKYLLTIFISLSLLSCTNDNNTKIIVSNHNKIIVSNHNKIIVKHNNTSKTIHTYSFNYNNHDYIFFTGTKLRNIIHDPNCPCNSNNNNN